MNKNHISQGISHERCESYQSAGVRRSDEQVLDQERYELLQRPEDWLETPMVILAFVWLAQLIGVLVWCALRLFVFCFNSRQLHK